MDVISNSSSTSIGRSLPLLPRPEPKEIPYMIEIVKEMWKVNCEKDYSDRMESLHRHNKLNIAISEIILLTWMHDINESNDWHAAVTCNICMDVVRLEHIEKRVREDEDSSEIGYFVPSCPHAFCSACLAQYLEVKMKEPVMTFPVKCPQYDCNNVIPDNLAEKVLDVESMTVWWDKHTEAGMNNKIYCPHPDCAVPLENDLIEIACSTMAECPVCNRAFCSDCKTMWHPGISCEENMAWTAEQKDMLALLNTADSLLWSCCPKCKNIIEKNQGCNHMTCVCKAEFCYRCGNPWTHENYTGCTAKCQSWSNAKLAEERKRNMPSLPGMESVAKSKIKDGKANALRRSKTITRDIEARRARNVVGGRIREMFRR